MMKFKNVCRCLTAWTLSMSMILSGAFMVQAEDLSDNAAAVQAEAGDLPNVETADFSDTEIIFGSNVSGQISDGTESEGKAAGEEDYKSPDGQDGDGYELDILYPAAGNDWMSPGEEMVVSTILYHDWYRSDEDRGHESIANYRLEVTKIENAPPVEAAVDGKNIVLKANADSENFAEGYGWISIRAVALDKDGNPTGEECSASFGIGVAKEYDVLKVTDEEIEELRTLAPGMSMQLNPSYVFVDQGKEIPVFEEYQYRLEWDEDMLTITDASQKILSSDDRIGTAPFTIKKLNNDWTDLRLIADRFDENGDPYEAGSVRLVSEGREFSAELNVADNRYDEYRNTWMYTNENVTLTLSTDNLRV